MEWFSISPKFSPSLVVPVLFLVWKSKNRFWHKQQHAPMNFYCFFTWKRNSTTVLPYVTSYMNKEEVLLKMSVFCNALYVKSFENFLKNTKPQNIKTSKCFIVTLWHQAGQCSLCQIAALQHSFWIYPKLKTPNNFSGIWRVRLLCYNFSH